MTDPTKDLARIYHQITAPEAGKGDAMTSHDAKLSRPPSREEAEAALALLRRWAGDVTPEEAATLDPLVSRLLPGVKITGPDASDALAVAITHAHHLASARLR